MKNGMEEIFARGEVENKEVGFGAQENMKVSKKKGKDF